jgi:hypothetical protein
MFDKKEKVTDKPVEKPTPDSNHNGTSYGYKVEARRRELFQELIRPDGTVLNSSWKIVHFPKNEEGRGIPTTGRPIKHELEFCNLLGYESAQALRWWYLSELPYGCETRLRKYKIEYAFTVYKEEPVDMQEKE